MGVGFTLGRIATEQFATFPEQLDANQKVDIVHAFKFMLKPDVRQLGIVTSFDFKQKQAVVMRISVSAHFQIGEDAWSDFESKNKVIFPKDFITNITGITIGISRGVLHTKNEHTEFSRYMLPLLDISKVITSELTFEFPPSK